MKLGKLLALVLPLVLVMVLAVACGDDEPEPSAPAGGITAAELQAAIASIQIPEGLSEADVSRIVTGAAQPGISAADVSKIVSDELAAQPGISAADLQKAVDSAVGKAVAALPTVAPGVTAAQLQSAVASIQIPTGLSQADVSKIISDQLAKQPGISSADLQAAVDAAVTQAVTAAAASAALAAQEEEEPSGRLNVAHTELGPYQAHPTLTTFPAASLNTLAALEGLVGRDLEWNYFGKLAEEWGFASDQLTWTFKLKKGVQFHDGWGEVTAEDFIFSVKAAAAEGSLNPAAPTHRANFLNPEGHLIALDDHTIELNTGIPKWDVMIGVMSPGPDPIYVVSKKQTEELEKTIGLDAANSILVGTAPWKIVDSQPGEFWHFEAVMDHYRKTPSFAEMKWFEMPEEATRIANFLTRRIDVFTAIPDTIPKLAGAPGTEFMAQKGAIEQHILIYGNKYVSYDPETCPGRPGSPWPDRPEYVNCPAEGWDPDAPWVSPIPDMDSPEWDAARKVRLAMMIAIDRQKLIDELLHGEGEPLSMQTWSNQPNKPEWVWEYDLERAKQLLEEAGYGDGFEVDLYPAVRGAPAEVEGCEAVGAMWETLGLDVNIIKLPFATLVEPWLDHSFKGISCNAAPPFPDATWLWNALHMPDAGVTTGFDHPVISNQILDAYQTFDPEERWEKTLALGSFFWDNTLDYGLYTVNQIHALGPKVGDWGDKLETGNGRRVSALEWAPHREE